MIYSLDFRRHVFAFKNKHTLTFEETSAHFEISIRTLFRWSKRIEPCATRSRAPSKINTQKLLDDIKKHPDDYQYERAKRFGVSQSGMNYALKRLKITRKKNINA